MSLALIASAHIAAQKIRENMYGGGSSDSSCGLSDEDKELLATHAALLQCQDLSDVPTVNQYIQTNTNAKARTDKSCVNCKHSKYFPYLIETDDAYCSKYVCLERLKQLYLEDSIVDNEHICLLYEYDENEKCVCCKHGE